MLVQKFVAVVKNKMRCCAAQDRMQQAAADRLVRRSQRSPAQRLGVPCRGCGCEEKRLPGVTMRTDSAGLPQPRTDLHRPGTAGLPLASTAAIAASRSRPFPVRMLHQQREHKAYKQPAQMTHAHAAGDLQLQQKNSAAQKIKPACQWPFEVYRESSQQHPAQTIEDSVQTMRRRIEDV